MRKGAKGGRGGTHHFIPPLLTQHGIRLLSSFSLRDHVGDRVLVDVPHTVRVEEEIGRHDQVEHHVDILRPARESLHLHEMAQTWNRISILVDLREDLEDVACERRGEVCGKRGKGLTNGESHKEFFKLDLL